MKQEFLGCVLMALAAGSAGAQTISTVTASDGTTGASSTYSAQGFVIDFNANNGSSAAWSPVLVGGDQYALDSISVQLGSTDASTTPEYLGVYSGTPSSSTYLGVSANAINFSTVTVDTWQQYTFNGVDLTADSGTVFTGSGTLYFAYQTSPAAQTGYGATTVPILRFAGTTAATAEGALAEVVGFGSVQTSRAPQYEASVTAVPEPSTLALMGCSGFGLLLAGRRLKK